MVRAGAGKFKFGDGNNIGELVSVSIDPNEISLAKVPEGPLRLSSLSAFSPGKFAKPFFWATRRIINITAGRENDVLLVHLIQVIRQSSTRCL